MTKTHYVAMLIAKGKFHLHQPPKYGREDQVTLQRQIIELF